MSGGSLARRGLGSPALFAVVYTSVASAIYFALGVVADNALGLTPLVFLVAGLMFGLTAMTYVEGASLHRDRAGATVFARYAFNELVSFVAAWAVLLDFLILIALTAYMTTDYAAVVWEPLSGGGPEIAMALAVVAYVAARNVLGFSTRRSRRVALLVGADIVVQVAIIVIGLLVVVDAPQLVDQVELGTAPGWAELVFALTLTTVAFTSLESASGLSAEVRVSTRGLRRLVAVTTATVVVLYVGIAVVALSALPVRGGESALGGRWLEAPLVGVVEGFGDAMAYDALAVLVAALAVMTLVAAAQSAMLGLSRLAYQLGTNRQIPRAVGRLHPTRATPFVVIAIAAVLAAGLSLSRDLELMAGMYAFGATLAFTIAHASIVVLRFREPARPRPYRVPGNVTVRGVDVPLPVVLGGVLWFAAWVSVVVLHDGARTVGAAWMAAGVAIYLVYRASQGKSLVQRVVVPEQALRAQAPGAEYASILVPVMGSELDADIVQTACRLASGERHDVPIDEGEEATTIEAVWVIEVPMSLPLDARLPDEQLRRARAALARAKQVGEAHEGVGVATSTVRARRAGQAIVEQAERRGVEAIVMAAEPPTRVRGGAVLGGLGGPRDDVVGAVTRYVVDKAPCRVILTAPPV